MNVLSGGTMRKISGGAQQTVPVGDDGKPTPDSRLIPPPTVPPQPLPGPPEFDEDPDL